MKLLPISGLFTDEQAKNIRLIEWLFRLEAELRKPPLRSGRI